jgi:uncharacterized protein with HEPN domain
MTPEDRIRVRHMLDAIESALKFIDGRSRQDLDSDLLLVFALVRAIEVVGEAASKVSEDGRSNLPEVAWGKIIGMRNRLVHAYFDVDADILWNTVTTALPPLQLQLQGYLEK